MGAGAGICTSGTRIFRDRSCRDFGSKQGRWAVSLRPLPAAARQFSLCCRIGFSCATLRIPDPCRRPSPSYFSTDSPRQNEHTCRKLSGASAARGQLAASGSRASRQMGPVPDHDGIYDFVGGPRRRNSRRRQCSRVAASKPAAFQSLSRTSIEFEAGLPPRVSLLGLAAAFAEGDDFRGVHGVVVNLHFDDFAALVD